VHEGDLLTRLAGGFERVVKCRALLDPPGELAMRIARRASIGVQDSVDERLQPARTCPERPAAGIHQRVERPVGRGEQRVREA
jgi:hypothetical protein